MNGRDRNCPASMQPRRWRAGLCRDRPSLAKIRVPTIFLRVYICLLTSSASSHRPYLD